ncbi:MAG: Ig-like domain-containing protein [Arcticibacter sp.]
MRAIQIISLMLFLASCANKVAPTGGAKDMSPPKVRLTSPEQGALSFTGKEISIAFDEFVQLKDAARQVVVSPPVFPKPTITAVGKTVKVEFEKLADSTTYVIGFGNAITDVNEGNALSGYRFVFSTGPVLDSLQVEGVAYDITNGKPLKGAMAMLFDSKWPDSVMVLRTPDHFARCDSNGAFRIENAAEGSYRLMVLSEKTENYLLDDRDELAGFSSETVVLPTNSKFNVWAAPQPPNSLRMVSANLVPPATLVTAFNGDARNVVFEGLNVSLQNTAIRYSSGGDTISHFLAATPDSLPVVLVLRNNGAVLDTAQYNQRSQSKTGGLRDPFKPSLMSDNYAAADAPIELNVAVPLRAIDPARMRIFRDSVQLTISTVTLNADSMSVSVAKPSAEGRYNLRLDAGALTDFYGRLSDSCTFAFDVPAEKMRGSIQCKWASPVNGNVVVELLNEKSTVVRSLSASDTLTLPSLPPGKYRLRVLHDLNGNGKWDMGNIRNSQQPEPIDYHPSEITVRGNWEVEVILENGKGLDGQR